MANDKKSFAERLFAQQIEDETEFYAHGNYGNTVSPEKARLMAESNAEMDAERAGLAPEKKDTQPPRSWSDKLFGAVEGAKVGASAAAETTEKKEQ